MKKSLLISFAFSALTATNANAQDTKKANNFHHIESVVSDGKFLYVADIGTELKPSAKDGDGQIAKLDRKGKILDASFVKEPLNAPKGLAVFKDILFINDINRIVAINLETGTKIYEINFGQETTFLNDIAIWDKNTLYVSATDTSKLYKVDLTNKSFTEVKLNTTISGINGLYCAPKSNKLYVNGFGSNNQPNGVFGCINLKDNTFTQITAITGYYDGICIKNDVLYLSNWMAFEKKGFILSVDLTSTKVARVNLPNLIAGPADFIIDNNQLIIPSMLSGELLFFPIDTDLKQRL
ncbi:hypothetical protein [Flavobacterium sp.]|uniref:hypothetical protein n=1 Tax=Flavobacterium sp. TaxID=239 RepID=UPI00286BE6C2|nr:hypothetical protein [Flavobacterium sp.]